MMQPAKPPPPHISPTGMWASKLALRILQFVLAIAIIGCIGSIVNTGVWTIFGLVVIVPQAVVSAVWSLAEGICIICRGGHRGIHPGANVALDLLLWLGLVAGTVLLWFLGVATTLVSNSYSYSSYDSYSYSDPYGLDSELERVAGMGQALIGLAATLTILHFVTFVMACVETSQRNRSKPVVYVTSTGQYPPQYAPQYAPQYGQDGQMYPPAQPQQAYQQPGMKV